MQKMKESKDNLKNTAERFRLPDIKIYFKVTNTVQAYRGNIACLVPDHLNIVSTAIK